MPMRRRRAQYHQLTTGQSDHIIDLHELGLPLRSTAVRVGHNVSIIQCCVKQGVQEVLRACRKESGAYRQAYSSDDYSRIFLHSRWHPKPAAFRTKCLTWCHHHRNWTIEWHRVLFIDEYRFCLWKNDGRRRVWRPPGERDEPNPFCECQTGPTQFIMVWGSMTFDTRTPLMHSDKCLNADYYVTQIVEPPVLPLMQGASNMVFQQEYARLRPFSSKLLDSRVNLVDEFLKSEDIHRMDWPIRSSDLISIDCQVIYSQFGLAIHQNDHQARHKFVEDFHKRILFSDEAHFWLNGYVNKQNYRIWNEANPQVYVETPLHPEKLTVWCALWAGGTLLQKR
ncbi:transposable element Tc1 transposase [Trichonephila clavipes]|uniref:Transposable element Tc1 transposase n=1 Tax=Trichonephila clavipes TaxID=2585209 RepID=A0A8X6VRF2_TRICX|nr:transposable element Tc1 transposase [Trichonephila clavipes]